MRIDGFLSSSFESVASVVLSVTVVPSPTDAQAPVVRRLFPKRGRPGDPAGDGIGSILALIRPGYAGKTAVPEHST